jgi:hypothetical protein
MRPQPYDRMVAAEEGNWLTNLPYWPGKAAQILRDL